MLCIWTGVHLSGNECSSAGWACGREGARRRRRRRRRAPDASREWEHSQGPQTRWTAQAKAGLGRAPQIRVLATASPRADGAGGHARHRMRTFSRGLHLVAQLGCGWARPRTPQKDGSVATPRQPDAPARNCKLTPISPIPSPPCRTRSRCVSMRSPVTSAPTLSMTTTAPLPERAQTDLPLVPASDGQRPQDPPHVLQGKAVPQAHSPQGHPVQDGQGLAFRSGKASLRQEAVRCVTSTMTFRRRHDGTARDGTGRLTEKVARVCKQDTVVRPSPSSTRRPRRPRRSSSGSSAPSASTRCRWLSSAASTSSLVVTRSRRARRTSSFVS